MNPLLVSYFALASTSVFAYFVVGAASQPFLYSLVGVLTVAATLYASRGRGMAARAWRRIALGLALWVIADGIWTGAAVVGSHPGFPSIADGLYGLGYPFIAMGLWLAVGSERKSLDRLLDSAIVAVGASTFVWVFVLSGYFHGAGADIWETVWSGLPPALDVVLIAVLVRVAFARRSWRASTLTLTIGFCLVLVADLIYARQALLGAYVEGGLLDAGWLIGYVAVGVAALLGTSGAPEIVEAESAGVVRPGRLVITLLGALLTPVVFVVEMTRGKPLDLWFAIPASLAISVLVGARLARLVRLYMEKVAILEVREVELAASEEKYRGIFENVLEGLYQTTENGQVLTMNPAGARIFGFSSPEEAIEGVRNTSDFYVDPERRMELVKELQRAGHVAGFEAEVRRTDGRQIWIQMEARLITPPVGDPTILGFFMEITERKRMEERLRHSQKMTAVGQLAGGVAHDFNNLLSVIMNFGNFALEGLDPASQRYADVAEMLKAGAKAASLTRQLLAFSREEDLAPVVLDANEVVRNMEPMLRGCLNERVVLDLRLHPQLWGTKIDVGQLERVLVDLAINANDAMPQGGVFTIETENLIGLGGAGDGLSDSSHEQNICIRVTDTGVGMPREVSDRVFEPFFTTKEVGEGSGLGLSSVYGIVDRVGGSIWLQSEPGLGTTVEITLSRVEEDQEPALSEP